MKKILTVLMVLIAVFCTAFAFSACDLFGTGDNGGNTSDNGGSIGNGNTGNNGNNSSSGGNFHTCVFVFTKKVDGCETNGYDLYTCKEPTCGKTEQHGSYAPVGHDYKHIEKPATCTSNKYESDVCNRCGHEENKRNYPNTKLEHAYNWVETTKATCTADGLKTGTCPDCGAVKTETLAQLEHNLGAYVPDNNATCTSFETKTAVCADCGYKNVLTIPNSKKDHNYGPNYTTTEATCGKDATKTFTCVDCGNKHVETIPDTKLPHDYGKWTTIVGDCQTLNVHKRTCQACGYEDSYTDGYGNHKITPKSSYGVVSGDTCELCGAGLPKTTGKFYLDLTTDEAGTSTGDGNLGAVYLEFTVLSVNGAIMTYNMDLIQEYTVDGEKKTTRQPVAVAYDGKNAGVFNSKLTLWSIGDNCELSGGGWLDYDVYVVKNNGNDGWVKVLLQFTFTGGEFGGYGKFAHSFYIAY